MRVRVKVGREWLVGTAQILPDDDPFVRLDLVASKLGRMRRLDAAIFRSTRRSRASATTRWGSIGANSSKIGISVSPWDRRSG
jgi:hypothetical protein